MLWGSFDLPPCSFNEVFRWRPISAAGAISPHSVHCEVSREQGVRRLVQCQEAEQVSHDRHVGERGNMCEAAPAWHHDRALSHAAEDMTDNKKRGLFFALLPYVVVCKGKLTIEILKMNMAVPNEPEFAYPSWKESLH